MTRPKNKPCYRIKRTDIFRHPKTRGMRAGAYALMDYAMVANILGVVRESPRSLVSHFEGMTLRELSLCIKCMVLRGVARWWPELDILWVVEALDEQSFSANTDMSAAKVTATLPPAVREAVALRYGDRVTGRGIPIPSPPWVGGTQKSRRAEEETLRVSPPLTPPVGGDQNAPLDSDHESPTRRCQADSWTQRIEAQASMIEPFPANDLPGEGPPGLLLATEAAKAAKPPRARRPRLPRADVEDDLVRHVCDEMRRACRDLTGSPTTGPEMGPNGAPCSSTNRDHIAKCQAAHNATPEQWTRVIRAQLANVRGNGKHQFLTLSTICAPQNFQRLLDMPSTSGGDRPLPWAPSRWETTTKEPS